MSTAQTTTNAGSTALLLLALTGCGGGDEQKPSGLDPPDMMLEPRYAVAVDVLEVGAGCVIGGLTPGSEPATASVAQTGATVDWYQTGDSAEGLRWNLTGHICTDGADGTGTDDTGHTIRLFGGRNTRVGDGQDAVCAVNLALPTGHVGGRAQPNRCADPRCSTVELVSDGCAGWVAEFEARLSYTLGCAEQPDCIMRMRWHARPDGADDACTPDLSGAAAWMQACRTLP